MSAFAVRCDPSGVIRAALRYDDRLEPEIVGRPFAALLDPSSLMRGLDLLERARREGVVTGRELLIRGRPDARIVVAAASVDEGGLLVLAAPRPDGLHALCAELAEADTASVAATTIRRALEDPATPREAGEAGVLELSRLYNELANMERELTKRNAELERISREKDRILGMASHDLRGPLNAIVLSVEYLQLELGVDLSDTARDVLGNIQRSAAAMRRLVEDLLDAASLENGRPTLKLAALSLEAILRETADMHRALARERDVRVELVLPAPLPVLTADGDRLRQVLTNLVTNAVDHTPPGGRVVLSASPRDDAVVVEVTDEGKGIDPADLPRLFRPFERGRGTRYGGSSVGLGLAISRALIEAHGGRIEAANTSAGGAVFRFTLPRGR